MTTIPITLILTVTVVLGCILGLNYLRGVRSNPNLIGAHLIVGALGFEQMAMLRAQTAGADTLAGRPYGTMTLVLFCFTIMAGLIAALVRRQPRTAATALAGHVAIGVATVLSYMFWIFSL